MTTENTTPDPNAQPNEQPDPNAQTPEVKAPLTLEGDGAPAKDPPTVKDEDKSKDPPKGNEVVPVQYNPTGDAGLDMVLKFVGDLGYGPENPAMQAAINGDFTMLSAELAAKGVKGADQYIKLGEQAYTRTKEATEKKQAADRKAVTDVFGGEAEWTKVQAWARENATPEEAKEISAELAAGGFRAKAAAVFLKDAYAKAQGPKDTDGEGEPVAKAKGQASNTGALSPREYAKEVAKLRAGFKGDFDNSPQYKALQARRAAYRE